MDDQPTVRKKCNEALNQKIGKVLARQIERQLADPALYDPEVIDLAARWMKYNQLPITE